MAEEKKQASKLAREDLLSLQLAMERRRRCEVEVQMAQQNFARADAEMRSLMNAIEAQYVDVAVGETASIDPDTGAITRSPAKKPPLSAV